MKKRVGLIFGVLLFVSLFSVMVAAQDISEFDNCDSYCDAFWMSAMPACAGEQATSGIYPDCECGWECSEDEDEKKEIFDEDDDYRCEDMGQNDCEGAKGCESIFESLPCEGEVCPMGMIWKGCRYEGDDFFEDYEDEELGEDAGSKPGDTFYFIDRFFDRFGDDLKVKEERIAEIKELIEAGDIEGARVALEDYVRLADELEHEIDPEDREAAKRSAAAIRAAMKDIRDMLPPGERGDFVSDVMSREHKIAAAGEIAGKIKELCIQLAELDPLEYSKMCRTGDDAPKWQRELDADLSVEQEEIARDFVDVMKNCFKSSGQDCACEDIPFYDFSVACSKAAPLASACDIDGDEVACDELDALKMPELPEWLQPIWEDLESGMNEAQYDMHMPRECIEEGISNPKECKKVMVRLHAPLECKAALLDSGCESESECKKVCDKVTVERHSPKCAEAGITTGDECKVFMDNYRGDDGGFRERGPDCMSIEDAMERLECYDNKGSEIGEHYGTGERFEDGGGEITWQCKEHRIHWGPDCETFMREELPLIEKMEIEEGEKRRMEEGDWRVKEKECALRCEAEQKPWDFRNGECVCKERDYEDYYEADPTEFGGPEYTGGSGCDDCSSQCPAGANTDCVNSQCVCLDVPDTSPQYGEGEGPGEPGDFDDNGEAPSSDNSDSGSDDSSDGGSGVDDSGSDDSSGGDDNA